MSVDWLHIEKYNRKLIVIDTISITPDIDLGYIFSSQWSSIKWSFNLSVTGFSDDIFLNETNT